MRLRDIRTNLPVFPRGRSSDPPLYPLRPRRDDRTATTSSASYSFAVTRAALYGLVLTPTETLGVCLAVTTSTISTPAWAPPCSFRAISPRCALRTAPGCAVPRPRIDQVLRDGSPAYLHPPRD